MSDARTLILLNEKRVKQSEPWNSTRGIYADFADGFDKPKYYCKCPNCQFVHGFYKTPQEAIRKKLCNGCHGKGIEKLKKEVHQIAFAESDEDIDPTEYVSQVFDWEGALKKLGFHYMHPGWHKRRKDHYWVSAEYPHSNDKQRVNVLLRDTRRNETIAWVQVPASQAVDHVLNYMKQSRVRESDDFDPTEEIERHADWPALLQSLGFERDKLQRDLWRRFWDGDRGTKWYTEIEANTPGHVAWRSYRKDGSQFYKVGKTDFLPVLELEPLMRTMHPSWFSENLSGQLTGHLLG